MIRLRAHHLLCMLTYVGQGYCPAFVANFDRLIERLAQGEEILLVEGPDEICQPLLVTDTPHCLQASVLKRDRQAAAALTEVLSCIVAPGVRLTFQSAQFDLMRTAFAQGVSRAACAGCEWSDLCTSVAHADFEKTKLLANIGES